MCFTPFLNIISWNIWPPVIPTNLGQAYPVVSHIMTAAGGWRRRLKLTSRPYILEIYLRRVEHGFFVREESGSGPDEMCLVSHCLIPPVGLLGILGLRLTFYALLPIQTGL